MTDITVDVQVYVSDEDINDIALMAMEWSWWEGFAVTSEEVMFDVIDPETDEQDRKQVSIESSTAADAVLCAIRATQEAGE